MAKLDKFYTKPEVAAQCYQTLLDTLPSLGVDPATAFFVEPSAGSGDFYDLLPKDRRVGYDIAPEHPEVIERDFFSVFLDEYDSDSKDVVVVGNPPFGSHSTIAIPFFNHATWVADTIAFIVPVSWKHHQTQVQLDQRYALVHSSLLQPDAFYDPDGKSYEAQCVYQVWHKYANKCLRVDAPILYHKNFRLFTTDGRNRSIKTSEDVWARGFDFVIYKTLYHCEFEPLFYPASFDPKKNHVYGAKVRNAQTFGRLMMLDYNKIARKNVIGQYDLTQSDIYAEYIRLYGR